MCRTEVHKVHSNTTLSCTPPGANINKHGKQCPGGCWSEQGVDSGINIEGRIEITGGEVFLVISFGLGLQILSNVTTMQHYI